MNAKQAANIIRQAVESIRASYAEHKAMQAMLDRIEDWASRNVVITGMPSGDVESLIAACQTGVVGDMRTCLAVQQAFTVIATHDPIGKESKP